MLSGYFPTFAGLHLVDAKIMQCFKGQNPEKNGLFCPMDDAATQLAGTHFL